MGPISDDSDVGVDGLNQLESEPTREEMSEKLVQTDEKSAEATQARSNLEETEARRLIKEAGALNDKWEVSHNPADLDEALALSEKALTLIPPNHLGRSDALNQHTLILINHIGPDLGDKSGTNPLIKNLKEALGLTPPGHEDRGTKLASLGLYCVLRYIRLDGPKDDADDGIRYLLEALDILPGEDTPSENLSDGRAVLVGMLVVAFFARNERDPDHPDLQRAVDYSLKLLGLQPEGHRLHAHGLVFCARAMFERYLDLGRLTDLDESIAYQLQSLALRPKGDSDRWARLINLSQALILRYKVRSNLKDLTDALALLREAEGSNPDHQKLGTTQCYLAECLGLRFKVYGARKDLDQAIEYLVMSLNLSPTGNPQRAQTLNLFALQLLMRYQLDGQLSDLEISIKYLTEATELRAAPLLSAICMSNLGQALGLVYQRSGIAADLDRVIECHQQSLAMCPKEHPERPTGLGNLGCALQARFNALGHAEDLENAISAHEKALASQPPGHGGRAAAVNNLAMSLFSRFQVRGSSKDLDNTISMLQDSLALYPLGHQNRAYTLSNLGAAHSARFEQQTNLEDLNASVVYFREALALRPRGHVDRGQILNNLATSLNTRYGEQGVKADIDEAVIAITEALEHQLAKGSMRATVLNNLAVILTERFRHDGKQEDLDNAIMYDRQALELTPPGNAVRACTAGNLGQLLEMRSKQKWGSRADLEEALHLLQESLELRPPGNSERWHGLTNVASGFVSRFNLTKNPSDLELAVSHYQQALDSCPPTSPLRSETLRYLAGARSLQIEHAVRESGRRAAPTEYAPVIAMAREATVIVTCPLVSRLCAAYTWINLSRKYNNSSTLDAFAAALSILDLVVAQHSSLEARYDRYRTMVGVVYNYATDAAATAIHRGELERAVTLLEQGRGLLFAQLGRYRRRLQKLREVEPDLASRFDSLSRQLDRSAVLDYKDAALERAGHRLEDTKIEDALKRGVRILYEKLALEWANVLETIRSKTGFYTFLRPTPFENLQKAAEKGPIIIVNISQLHSDALIIMNSGPPHIVPLSDAAPQVLLALSAHLSKPSITDLEVVDILRTIWEIIGSPIVSKLQSSPLNVPLGSRIWWCPTGPSASLPLHAAGPYKPRQKNLPHLYISSYTTTLGALTQAQQREDAPPTSTSKLLIISQPETPGQKSLPHVREEVRNISGVFPRAEHLEGGLATKEAVLVGMAEHPWIHLACHGHQDPNHPLRCHFSLNDEPLYLITILKQQIPNAELAILSACHSAQSNGSLPDEVLHLAAGMQFVGFRGVVGTLWAMADQVGPAFAQEFYKRMVDANGEPLDSSNAAIALNRATKVLAKNGVPLAHWINLVHFGI